jgi:hypothetical protein
MTVNTTKITSGPYVGNDVAETFSYTFKVDDKDQLSVYETNDIGIQTLLVVDTNYTVSGVGNDGGGIVTRIPGPLPTGYEWFIRSDFKETQLTAFSSQGPFFPDLHENAMDKLTLLIQQLLDEKSRSPAVSKTYTGSLPLSLDSPGAGFALRWNGSGTGLENYDPFSALTSDEIAADKPVINYSTLTSAVSDNNLKLNQACNMKERTSGNGGGAMWDVVLASSVTPNTYNIVQCTGVATLALVIRFQGKIDIKAWGAHDRNDVGFLEFDNTTVMNHIFAWIDTAYMTVNYQSMSPGGGLVFIPPGEYITTTTLFMGSSVLLYGVGPGSKFRFNPSTSLSFLEPKNKNFGVDPNAHASSNWQMKFRDFYVCVQPTGGTYPGYSGSPVTEYNRNTLHCFDMYDTMGTNFERVMVTDFWQGTAFKLDRRNEVFTYYHQINHCITRDCKRDIDTISATGVLSGSFSDRTNFPANTLGKDYAIVIGGDVSLGAGTTISGGVGVEGNANVALFLDRGNGTSITGCYFEAKKAPYVIDASDRDNVAGGANYSANHYGFTPAVLLNPVITATGISNYTDSVKLSAGEPMEIKIVEATTRATPSFRSSVEGLTWSPAGGLFLEGADAFLSGIYIELRRGAGTAATDNQANYTFLPAETNRGNEMTVWVTLMVKRISETDTTVRVFNTTSGNRDLRPVVVYTNGWELWGTYMTMVDGDATTLTVRQNAGSTSVSKKIQFSGLRVYQNGTPSMPAPYIYDEEASSAPAGGIWNNGEKVWNSDPSGVADNIGWMRTPSGFKVMGQLT